jgi:NADH dehydrogenase
LLALSHKLVTVFGGSGFIGRYVVRALAKEGYRIRVAVRRPNVAHFLRPMGRVGQIQLLAADLSDETRIGGALDGASAVVNLVGVLNQFGRQRFSTLHAKAPALIARHAKIHGATRVIQMSAIGADPRSPSHYGRSKGEGEAALKAEFPAATILRPSIVFGPEDDFFNRFANMARYSPVLPLLRGGKTRFQPVYVEDVARAVIAALGRPETAGATFELGGPEIYTFKALLKIVLAETGRHNPLLPLPGPLAALMALPLQILPKPPLTLDQLAQLKRDNILKIGRDAAEVGTLADLGLSPTALESILPLYLWRFRRAGQFETLESA